MSKSLPFLFIEPHHVFRVRQSIVMDEDSMVNQEHVIDSDITTILSRYDRTGVLPASARAPTYMDVSEFCGDFSDTVKNIRRARSDVDAAKASEADARLKLEQSVLEGSKITPPATPPES